MFCPATDKFKRAPAVTWRASTGEAVYSARFASLRHLFLIVCPCPIQPKLSMKNFTKTFVPALLALAVAGVVRADDSVVGKWKTEFESQIGVQKYTYEFKLDGTNLVGRA